MIENDGEGERSFHYRPKLCNSAVEASVAMAAVAATGAGDYFNAGYISPRVLPAWRSKTVPGRRTVWPAP